MAACWQRHRWHTQQTPAIYLEPPAHLCNHYSWQRCQQVHEAQAPAPAQPAHEQRRGAGGGAQGGQRKGQQVELQGVEGTLECKLDPRLVAEPAAPREVRAKANK